MASSAWDQRAAVSTAQIVEIAIHAAPWAAFFTLVTFLSHWLASSNLVPEAISSTYATLVVRKGAQPGSAAAKA
jgi:hypothetical protein